MCCARYRARWHNAGRFLLFVSGKIGITSICYEILCASCTSARQHAMRVMHNDFESMGWRSPDTPSFRMAPGADLEAIVVAVFRQGGLSDGLRRSEKPQIWLSGASNGILSAHLLLQYHFIHNIALYIVEYDNIAIVRPFRPCDTHTSQTKRWCFSYGRGLQAGHSVL